MAKRGDGAVEELGLTTGILQAQAEASAAAFVAVTVQGVLRSHNEAFASMWGLPAEVLQKGTLSAVVEWLRANAGEVGAALVKLLTEHDERTSGELKLCDGRVLEWRTANIQGDGGRVWALYDVTPTRKLASALRDAGNLLRIFEAHADGVALELDDSARIVGIWAAHAGFFDKPDATLQGRGTADAIGPAQGAKLDEVVRRVFATGRPESLEYVLDRGGERRVFSANAVFVPSNDDESPRVAVMIRDLSERVRLQTQLLEAEWLVSVGLLAAGVAHEINNPLAYSLLNLERIQRGLRDLAGSEGRPAIAELIDAVGVSLEGCRRVQTIVQDLRRFSASGRDDEVRGPIDVRRVLDFAIDMVAPQVRGRAQVVREFGQRAPGHRQRGAPEPGVLEPHRERRAGDPRR